MAVTWKERVAGWDRRRLGRTLLASAVVLFALALVLPVDNGGRFRGWQAVGQLVHMSIEDHQNLPATAVRLAILQMVGLFVVSAVALAVGFRTFSRAASILLVVVWWVVAGAVVWIDRVTLRDFGRLFLHGQGTLAWFVALPTLAAAAFVWPRTADRHRDDPGPGDD